ncbi:MTAP family purine nucleoside phosphorylase [Schumannella soli]|uniref:S-methyl-5'-thioadenosine phosphorylase n=1 Tax=Schumannella soli TaxID=2590779 RepID=A0A506XZ73_9MICO|nr:MTAP family purine nucleoside phosphorylase [Schumannella soli]TPW75516.1 MTAP family purine nucleoside phosphorylase [Schumannella soli]
MTAAATIGIIGGSGLYDLLGDDAESREVDTPYGRPSSPVSIGQFAGRTVAFLPRHGTGHSVAPHLINARANIWALASLGVTALVSTAAVGSIRAEYPPRALAVLDQIVDYTHGRTGTFFDQGDVQHLPFSDPFDPVLRRIMLEVAPEAQPTATIGIIPGPRFSTRAESARYRGDGVDLLNMTLAPEVALAAELGIGAVTLAIVTDTDAGESADDPDTVSAELVFRRLSEALPRIREIIAGVVAGVPGDFAPRELIAAEAVRRVLERPTTGSPATSGAEA